MSIPSRMTACLALLCILSSPLWGRAFTTLSETDSKSEQSKQHVYVSERDPFFQQTPKDPKQSTIQSSSLIGIVEQNLKTYALIRPAGSNRVKKVTTGERFLDGEVIGFITRNADDGREKKCVIFRQKTEDELKPYRRIEKCI